MDSLTTLGRAHRLRGGGNVVLRQGLQPAAWLLCCDAVESQADAAWAWQHIVCHGHVRALRGDDLIFAERADFNAAQQTLILTGSPRLRRGESLLEGDRIDVDVRRQTLHIARPRGALVTETTVDVEPPVPSAPGVPWAQIGPLPDRCPLAWEP